MVDFNSYINGLDLSRLTEYCINHGQLKQYAKGDYFVKEDEESRYIAYIECGYFNYKVTTKKWNAEECSNRFDLQRFHLSCRLFPTPP